MDEEDLLFLAGVAVIALLLVHFFTRRRKSSASPESREEYLRQVFIAHIRTLDFGFAERPFGIGIDIKERKLHLSSKFSNQITQKIYDFSEIRGWRYEIVSGGEIETFGSVGLSNAINITAKNRATHKANEQRSGLFVSVRDVRFPEWHVYFPNRAEREMELKRWIEILNQTVGETGGSA